MSQIQNEFLNEFNGYYENLPSYIPMFHINNWRTPNNIFKKLSSYDTFEKDIAMVQIIFSKSTFVQMGSQLRMSWSDYLSEVGGLLGLVLGTGFVSFIELAWLCFTISKKWILKLNAELVAVEAVEAVEPVEAIEALDVVEAAEAIEAVVAVELPVESVPNDTELDLVAK